MTIQLSNDFQSDIIYEVITRSGHVYRAKGAATRDEWKAYVDRTFVPVSDSMTLHTESGGDIYLRCADVEAIREIIEPSVILPEEKADERRAAEADVSADPHDR